MSPGSAMIGPLRRIRPVLVRAAAAMTVVLALGSGLGLDQVGVAHATAAARSVEPDVVLEDDPDPVPDLNTHHRRGGRWEERRVADQGPAPSVATTAVSCSGPQDQREVPAVIGTLAAPQEQTLVSVPAPAKALVGPIMVAASWSAMFWHRRHSDHGQVVWPMGTSGEAAELSAAQRVSQDPVHLPAAAAHAGVARRAVSARPPYLRSGDITPGTRHHRDSAGMDPRSSAREGAT